MREGGGESERGGEREGREIQGGANEMERRSD